MHLIAELRRERDEALAREVAIAEVLQVINSSPGDLAPVFDAMLEKAMRLCEAAFGIANIYDGERFHTAALRGVPEALAKLWLSDPPPPPPQSPLARILDGEDVAHIDDAEHLGGRGLLLQGLARLGDEARVLHRDDRLRREALQ